MSTPGPLSRVRALLRAAVVVMFASLAVPAGASASGLLEGSAFDRSDDVNSTDPDPSTDGARDLRHAAVAFDPVTGSIDALVTLTAAARAQDASRLVVVVGRYAGVDCGTPAAAVQASTVGTDAVWRMDGVDGTHPASAEISGLTVRLRATDPRLAGLPAPDCAWLMTHPFDTQGGNPYDVIAPFDLRPVTPAVPTPDPETPPPAPPAPLVPAGAGNKPGLAIGITQAPGGVVRRGRTLTFKLRLENAGSTAVESVELRAPSVRGVTVKPSRVKLRSLPAGESRTRTVRVTVGRFAKANPRITWRLAATGKDVPKKARDATAAGLRATTSARLRVGKRLAAADTGAPPLGRIYWRDEAVKVGEVDVLGYVFVNSRWAYRGLPSNDGVAGKEYPDCKRRTAKGSDGEGCIPWRVDASGRLTVDGRPATLKRDSITITELRGNKTKQNTFRRIEPLAPGARIDAHVEHTTVHGNCLGIGLNQTCSIGTKTLRLLPNGQYTTDSRRTTTIDNAGGAFIGIVGADPTSTGLYEVLSGGRIRLQPIEGPAEQFAFGSPATRGLPDPAGRGLWMGGRQFWLAD